MLDIFINLCFENHKWVKIVSLLSKTWLEENVLSVNQLLWKYRAPSKYNLQIDTKPLVVSVKSNLNKLIEFIEKCFKFCFISIIYDEA